MFEEAARREAANKAALESLGIDYESFGQKPWNEGHLDYEAPNGDYIKNYPLINRVEVIGRMDESLFNMTAPMFKYQNKMKDELLRYFYRD
jgi:hypothetical protein